MGYGDIKNNILMENSNSDKTSLENIVDLVGDNNTNTKPEDKNLIIQLMDSNKISSKTIEEDGSNIGVDLETIKKVSPSNASLNKEDNKSEEEQPNEESLFEKRLKRIMYGHNYNRKEDQFI